MVVGEVARPVQVLVIGGGPGGYTAAARAAELGKEVVLVERKRLGGVCLNVGCIPSKALITVAHDVARAGWLRGIGVSIAPDVDFAAVQGWKRSVVDRLVGGVGQLLDKVEVVSGTARLLGPRRVAVESADGVAHFRFDAAILATGSRPMQVPGLVVDGVHVLDSSGALALESVPASLAVVGGGYIGVELGIAYAKLGTCVTVVEMTDRILGGFDPELAREVERTLDRLGVAVRTKTSATGHDGGCLTVQSPDGTATIPAEHVLVAAGRQPNTDDLQLAEVGVPVLPSGHLEVDEQRRTSAGTIYAIGDITPGPALAHKAMEEGRVAAEVIAGLPSGFDQEVPLIAFTDPELASVGLTESAARSAGVDVAVGRSRFATSGRAATMGEQAGFVKVVLEVGSGVIRGVQIAGLGASDLIGAACLAVETACRAEDVMRTISPHPTLSEAFGEAAAAGMRRRERGTT